MTWLPTSRLRSRDSVLPSVASTSTPWSGIPKSASLVPSLGLRYGSTHKLCKPGFGFVWVVGVPLDDSAGPSPGRCRVPVTYLRWNPGKESTFEYPNPEAPIAQSRFYLSTLGPKAGMIYVLGAPRKVTPKPSVSTCAISSMEAHHFRSELELALDWGRIEGSLFEANYPKGLIGMYVFMYVCLYVGR